MLLPGGVRSSSSYSLVIKKDFDFSNLNNESEAVREAVEKAAREQEYTFKVTGTKKENGQDVKVNFEFTLPREDEHGNKTVWESETYKASGPFNVTVTELTDNIEIQDNYGNYYNMTNSSSDTNMVVDGRKHEIPLNNNSTLTISRPASGKRLETLWYHITNRPYDGHPTGAYKDINEIFSLDSDGEKSFDQLSAGIYTIEQIAAPDGYQIQMGERVETVAAGDSGRFHINGTPGKLTLTAGGTQGDGVTHYYRVDRTEVEEGDNSEFVQRTIPIASEKEYVLDNLPKGGYTVTEYTIDASEAFKVTFPETDERTKTGKSSALTSGTANSWKYMDLSYPKETFDVDYIRMVSFGPLFNSSGTSLNSSTSYAVFRYGVASDDGTKVTNIKNHTTGYTGNKTITITNAPKIELTNCKRLYFTVTGLKSTSAKTIGVSWIEYDEKETIETFKRAGLPESIKVDDRGWVKIEASALKDPNAPGAEQIAYYYTIRDKDGNFVPQMPDRDGKAIKLLPGASTEFKLPGAGSYTIEENITGTTSVGFTMKIEGAQFGTTEAAKENKVKVGGERKITISKPALVNHPAGTDDERKYVFRIDGNSISETLEIKAGESGTVTLPMAGEYTIRPDDALGLYGLNYKDCGAIYGTASGTTSVITFTNVFAKGKMGYRYIHEYYVKERDGTYTHEGNSQITTRRGFEIPRKFQAGELSQAPNYEENEYKHFDEAYGTVDPISTAVLSSAEAEKKASDEAYDERVPVATASSAKAKKKASGETYDGRVPVATASSAMSKGTLEKEFATDFRDGENHQTGSQQGERQEREQENGSDTNRTSIPGGGGQDSRSDGEYDTIFPVATASSAQSKEKSEEKISTGSASEGKEETEGTDTSQENGQIAESGNQTEEKQDQNAETGQASRYPDYRDKNWGEEYRGTSFTATPSSAQSKEDFDEEFQEDDYDEEEGGPGSIGTESSGIEFPITADREETESFYDESSDGDGIQPGELRSGTIFDSTGIISKGVGTDSKDGTLNYKPEPGKDHVTTTEEVGQIIILRYVREKQPEGKYNVIHVYYRRDEEGDHWEGVSGVQSLEGELGIKYTGERVEKEYSFKPAGAEWPYLYTWDKRPQYGVLEKVNNTGGYNPSGDEFAGNGLVYRPNNAWKAATGTEEGNQIIILRYYREPGREGNYNIVHEYYFRQNGESQDDVAEDGSESQESMADSSGSKSGIQPFAGDSEADAGEEDASGGFAGTLNRSDGYVYTFEGNTVPESVIGPLGSVHIAEEKDKKPVYGGNTYTYIDAGYGSTSADNSYTCNSNQQWAACTKNGNELIILRYYRDTGAPPPSYKVVHEYYFRDRRGRQTLVGTSDIRQVTGADPNVHYTEEHVGREPVYQGDTYTYFGWGCGTTTEEGYSAIPEKQYVLATVSGEEVIILRYYRQPDYPPSTGGGGSHEYTVKKVTQPVEETVPDGANSPAQLSAREGSGIMKNGLPPTGESRSADLWLAVAVCSLCGAVILNLTSRKRKGDMLSKE